MGENEQSGMLRTVVVIGIIAIVAMTIILAVVGLKGNMNSNTDSAIKPLVRTQVDYASDNPNVKFQSYNVSNSTWADQHWYVPLVKSIPANNWREFVVEFSTTEDVTVQVNINNYLSGSQSDDRDDVTKRSEKIYDDSGNLVASKSGNNGLLDRVSLKKDIKYMIVVKYFNNTSSTLLELNPDNSKYRQSALFFDTSDGRAFDLDVTSFKAATYDDKYAN